MGKNPLVFLIFVIFALTLSSAYGGTPKEWKFKSSGNLAVDAQNIRIKAIEMGWTLNKPFSFIAATVILGKDLIYPKSEVEISLRESDGQLQIRAQARAKDAGTAYWHNIHADRIKK